MKVLPFTILVPEDKSVISDQVTLPYFYQYLHRHEEMQITWVEKGRGTLIVGTDMHAFEDNDVFVIGANVPHLFKSNPEYFENNDELSIMACSLYFNPNGLLAPLFALPEMSRVKQFISKFAQGFKVPAQSTKAVTDAMLKVHQSASHLVIYELVKFWDIILQIQEPLEPICKVSSNHKMSESEGRRLSTIINYIMDYYHQPIALENIANTACMTPQAFCRYFKKHTGQTFVNYLNEVRIHDACRQLTSSSFSEGISNIAYKTGFNSITNFNRVFKSVVGQSPRAYIESYRIISTIYVP